MSDERDPGGAALGEVERDRRRARSRTARLRPPAAVLVAVALLAACGDVTSGDAEDTVLRVMLADDWATAPAIANAVTAFEAENPSVRVAVQGVPFAQIPDAVRAAQQGGPQLDVVQWHAFALAENGLADEVSDLWEAHGVTTGEWVPGALDDVVWEGGVFGIPLDTNALVLMVNRDALQDARLTPADLADPDGFRAALDAFATSSRRPMALSSSGWAAYGWIRAFDGEVVRLGDDGLDITFDDPNVIRALDYLAELIADGVAMEPTRRDVTRDATALFNSGVVAVHASGSWDVVASLEDAYTGPAVEVVPLPARSSEAGTALGGSSLAVAAGSPNRDLAFQLMLHLVEDEWVLRYAREEGRLPARSRLLDDPLFDGPPFETVVAQLPRASADRLIAFPAANQAFKDALEDVLFGRATAAEAMARAQRIADDELAART